MAPPALSFCGGISGELTRGTGNTYVQLWVIEPGSSQEGHTDNRGTFARNLALAKQRAEAVTKALVADYKVDAKRLVAQGVASLSPVATNESDVGRAKNRRVELVKQ